MSETYRQQCEKVYATAKAAQAANQRQASLSLTECDACADLCSCYRDLIAEGSLPFWSALNRIHALNATIENDHAMAMEIHGQVDSILDLLKPSPWDSHKALRDQE